jgi:hypothetical protein
MHINYVYQQLMEVGMEKSAVMFLEANKQAFNGYCTDCWVRRYIGQAMSDPRTSDKEKRAIVNHHIVGTIENVGAPKFWDAIGNPELN